MIIVTNAETLIIQWSEDAYPEPPEGGLVHELSQEEQEQLETLRASPNSGIKFDGASFIVVPVSAAARIVPSEAPAGGFIVALKRLNWKADVEDAIAQADEESQILFARATKFLRHDPRVKAIAKMIGKSEADLDELFILANAV